MRAEKSSFQRHSIRLRSVLYAGIIPLSRPLVTPLPRGSTSMTPFTHPRSFVRSFVIYLIRRSIREELPASEAAGELERAAERSRRKTPFETTIKLASRSFDGVGNAQNSRQREHPGMSGVARPGLWPGFENHLRVRGRMHSM